MTNPVLKADSSLSDWLSYLETLHPSAIDLGLGRIREVAQRLNIKLDSVVITVGGTNGKGSTCAMLEAILLAAAYKVGVYASPHLVRYNERIRLNGEMAQDAQITAQFARINEARGDLTLTYFEFSTLAALLLFQEQRVDVAVLEVGLGGRLDAVNIVDADCSIITSIDIDHAEYLGNTREQVAWEKAHIFRADRPAICADPVPPQTMLDYAEEIGAQLWLFGKDFNYSGDRQQWAYGGRSQRRAALAYPALRGANQLLNASAALAALESLHPRLAVPAQAVRAGLLRAHMPGRFQIQPGQPCVIFDVAHNPHAAAALAQNLDNMPPYPKTIAVVGMYKDKDVDGVIARMATRIDHWMCASLEGPRSMSGEELANHVRAVLASGQTPDDVLAPEAESGSHRPGVRPVARASVSKASAVVSSYNSPQLAYEAALKEASDNDRIVVFGSFATVGPILEAANDRSSS
ncbi:bifunctional tetrahydrofolate synthase/dihydrofolate synthase [Alcaligenes nematophilus]|uniref:bifunctional tetrahydrofolate synthase/dihydrofolate synthase n=1 Tax=Alcaligenes nematophilus TaxID=2994643 RepID=UPI00384C4DC8